MRVLLAELLADRSLDLVLRACPEALDRPIQWVHTTELRDPAPYLSGGELILTTGVWRRRAADSGAFVASLVASGACGLVYGLPRPRARMPADLVEACRRNGLPLLEATFELPFISISKTVMGRFAQEREAPLHRSLRRNERLAAALASGRGAEGILAVLASERLSTWLLGPGGRLLARAGARVAALDLEAAQRSLAEVSALPADLQLPGAASAAAFALGGLGGRGAHLVVDRRLGELAPEARAAIDQALTFLALELARVHAQRAGERRAAAELLDLLAGGPARSAEAAARLAAHGLDPEAPVAVLAAVPLRGSAEELADALEPFAGEHGPAAVAVADGQVALILSPGEHEPLTLAQRLERAAPAPVVVGAGSAAATAEGRRRSVVEARELARFLARRGVAGAAGASELGTHALLLGLLSDDVRDAYRGAVLGPLLDDDRRRGGELVATLAAFFATGGRFKETAGRLHVHVNTLRHRLERIERLTGRDLDATADRVDLSLALALQPSAATGRGGGPS